MSELSSFDRAAADQVIILAQLLRMEKSAKGSTASLVDLLPDAAAIFVQNEQAAHLARLEAKG